MLWLPQLNATFNKEKGNPARKMAALAWEMYNISTISPLVTLKHLCKRNKQLHNKF